MKVSVHSLGLGIWVSSTSFKKSNMDWPQQPPTEKILKFNMGFHDSVKKIVFSKHQNKWYRSSDYWFQEPEWLSSDFPGLTNLCSLIDLTGLCNLTGLNSLYSHISSKNFLVLMVLSSLDQNYKHWSFFVEWIIKIPIFTNIWYLFLLEAVEARLCYFFKNFLMKLKCPNLRKIQIHSL